MDMDNTSRQTDQSIKEIGSIICLTVKVNIIGQIRRYTQENGKNGVRATKAAKARVPGNEQIREKSS